MFVILCHPGDAAALWLHAELQRLGAGDVELVAVEQVVYSLSITHRLNDDGDRGVILLGDGRALRVEAIRALINRVEFLPQDHFRNVAEADRAYAVEELSAFLLAWLDAVPGRVINPARPNSLGGAWLPVPTLMHLAAFAGLPTKPWCVASDDGGAPAPPSPVETSAIVFDGRVFGRIPPSAIQEGCRRLAVLTGMPLLQVDFSRDVDGALGFRSANGAADFRLGGRALATALLRAAAVDGA